MKREEYQSIISRCDGYYPAKKASHCEAVERYASEDLSFAFLSESQQWFVRALAYAHDVIEDTKCPLTAFNSLIHDADELCDFQTDLILLTHDKSECSYYEYVRRIVDSKRLFPLMVKRADMKDHLLRRATLSPKLQAKYAPVLPLLLGGPECLLK